MSEALLLVDLEASLDSPGVTLKSSTKTKSASLLSIHVHFDAFKHFFLLLVQVLLLYGIVLLLYVCVCDRFNVTVFSQIGTWQAAKRRKLKSWSL